MNDLPPIEALFDEAPCGLMLVDLDGTILVVNQTFCAWSGFLRDELTAGRRWQDLLTIGGRLFHQTHWAPLLELQGSVSEVKLELVHKDGRKVPILVNAARRQHGERRFDELAVVVVNDRQKYEKDIQSARKAAESANEQLAQADLRKDEFLATLAHELRNPLAPMRNVVQILKLQSLDNHPKLVWVRDVLDRQVNQMALLVDDLMEVSRVVQGKLVLKKVALDLRTICEAAIDVARALIDESGHELTVDLPDHAVILLADPGRVTQMVLNLLTNAARYTPDGGHIWLTVGAEGDQAVISVRDTGIGIAAANLSSIFEMFAQVSPASERGTVGMGIGLALVRGLVALHGGMIVARSEGEGAGSEFVIRLPLA